MVIINTDERIEGKNALTTCIKVTCVFVTINKSVNKKRSILAITTAIATPLTSYSIANPTQDNNINNEMICLIVVTE